MLVAAQRGLAYTGHLLMTPKEYVHPVDNMSYSLLVSARGIEFVLWPYHLCLSPYWRHIL